MRRGEILPFGAPIWVPKSSIMIAVLLVGCSMITSTVSFYLVLSPAELEIW